MATRYATSLVLLLVLSSFANAQKPTLDQAEAQLRMGQLAQARAILAQWKSEHPNASGSTDDGARATYLSARLATKADDAEDAYLAVAISAPSSSPYIAESLLRVGQAEMAKGAARNAIPYLQRLVDNYPQSEFATLGKEWLARAQGALPNDAARQSRPTVDVAKSAKASATPAMARYAVQVAAFRERSNARAIARSVAQAGFSDVRIVVVPGSALTRVRVGRFTSETGASDAMKRLQAAGYKPAVVADVQSEQTVRD